MSKIYKIRRKSDGLFSCGGINPKFNKQGKCWNIGTIKTHLRQHQSRNFSCYKDCELVVFVEVVVEAAQTETFESIIAPMQQDEVVKRLKSKR